MAVGYHKITLSNGLRLVVRPMPDRYSTTIAIYVGVGSRYESSEEAGSSHLLEHMYFKGTRRRPAPEDISDAIESVGGSLNASTDKEATVFWAKVAGGDTALALDVLGDMLLNSRVSAADVRKEKHVVEEELGMIMDSPQDRIHALIEETIWPDDALGRDVAGTKESVAGLTHAGLKSFRRRHYTPRATVVSVAGHVGVDAMAKMVEKVFGHWRGGAAPAHPPGCYPAAAPFVRLERRQSEQTNLCLALRGLAHCDPRRHALDLLNSILGGGMSSRLFVEVRERRGLVYDIHSYGDRLDDTGFIVVYAGMDPQAAPAVIDEILGALRRLREERVPAIELAKAKSQYRGRLLLGLEDTSSVASWAGAQELMLDRINSPEEVLECVEAVTADDIRPLAEELFRDEYLRLAVIGPYTDQRKFADLLHL